LEKRVIECFCGGKADLKFEDLKIKTAGITIKDTGYYKCRKCADKFSTSEQMHDIDRKLKTQLKMLAKA